MKKTKIFSVLFVCLMILSITLFAEADRENQAGWKAGVSSVNITPEESMWMAGYAARNRPSEGVLHPIWAKALALEDSKGQIVVLITTDLIGFRGHYMSDRIRQRLYEKYDLSTPQVVLSSSHTHTGPELMKAPDDYMGLDAPEGQYSYLNLEKVRRYSFELENKLVDLVGNALSSMVPVKVFSGNGTARFAVNRRNNTESKLNSASQLNGPVDHSVPIIKITKHSGELLALVFGYACHNTTLGFYQFSGDYAGFAQIELEKNNPGATAMFFAGCGADQNPLPRRTVSLAVQYGKTLASAVEAIVDEPMKELSPSLSMAFSKVELKFENPPPTKDELLKILEISSGYPEYLKDAARVLLAKLEKGLKLMESYHYPVQYWKLGEQKLIILASEVVVDYALRLKEIHGDDIFIMAYANEGVGYIPSTNVLKEGGYEGTRSPVFTTPWASDIEEVIIAEVLKLIKLSE